MKETLQQIPIETELGERLITERTISEGFVSVRTWEGDGTADVWCKGIPGALPVPSDDLRTLAGLLINQADWLDAQEET